MFRKLALSLTLALCALPAAARENYALLIGANDYPNLDQKYWLNGPKNDVELVRDYLLQAAPVPFAPQNVVLLTDGTPGVQPATLQAIRDQIAALTAKAQPGDFIYLHFSGHGTRAPATHDPTELDGLDELFLPVDIGPWNDTVGAVENALVDDEIGAMIDGLRAKGADVWVVFDSCHSGTATRAADIGDDDLRLRQLDPAALGLDPDALEEIASRSIGDPRAPEEPPVDLSGSAQPGAFIAFYAAQTNEVTPEKNLPKGKPDRKPQGVFTYTLFETLAEHPGATYGQIGQEILRKYAVKNLARATPLFEGDLDAVAFSGDAAAPVTQWQAEVQDGSFTIPAGDLHGIALGDLLAVMASAADATDAALGYVQVTEVQTFSTTATPVAHDGKTLPEELPKGVMLRKLGAAVDFTLTVALPPPGTSPADALLAELATLQELVGPRLIFVAPGAEADLRLAVLPQSPRPDAIWVLPATGLAEDLSQTPSVSSSDKSPQDLALTLGDTLTAMARALNLMKLGGSLGSGSSLNVEVEMLTKSAANPSLTPLAFTPVPVLLPNDEVHVLAQNHSDQPVDVNVLYLGADYAITHWAAERLHPGDTLKRGLFAIGGEALGQERMIVVVTPAQAHSPVENLSFLAQDALELTREVTAGQGAEPGLSALLAEAGFGETTRGAVALGASTAEAAGPAPIILQMELRTRPAP
ncbi:caspase family protein [Xinfangfangia sp. CPCC 101601]|uniref:Caspase family protein n=1 Tax=Pseudogemmobacter lacusdianii TaxID=3069608 RepID=A0ABU0VW31_9RHOB|nr:caspase family protein [Xinfangfangia sp. CPCC 101601]MDQ2065961.1 caspase family protein [Xinfangfangia sp. CPCC 101601]